LSKGNEVNVSDALKKNVIKTNGGKTMLMRIFTGLAEDGLGQVAEVNGKVWIFFIMYKVHSVKITLKFVDY